MRDYGRRVGRRADLVRFRDWWDFKLSPAAALFYCGAAATGAPLLPLVPQALLLLAAIAACAAFVSVLNDVTDLEPDALAGKHNRMAGRTATARAALLGLPALAGLGFALLWRDDPPLAGAYVGSFAAFVLYSAPPARLKVRGAAGAAADAAGAHLFPAMTALLLAFRAVRAEPDVPMLAAAAVWSVALGLRGILWHQLGDVEADARAGIGTLARRYPPWAVARFGERVLLPAEVVGLLVLLWRMEAAFGCLALAFYLAMAHRLFARTGTAPAIVRPRPGAAIALHDYYGVWLPAAMIVQSALRHPADIAVLALHIVLFPARARQSAAAVRQALWPRARG